MARMRNICLFSYFIVCSLNICASEYEKKSYLTVPIKKKVGEPPHLKELREALLSNIGYYSMEPKHYEPFKKPMPSLKKFQDICFIELELLYKKYKDEQRSSEKDREVHIIIQKNPDFRAVSKLLVVSTKLLQDTRWHVYYQIAIAYQTLCNHNVPPMKIDSRLLAIDQFPALERFLERSKVLTRPPTPLKRSRSR